MGWGPCRRSTVATARRPGALSWPRWQTRALPGCDRHSPSGHLVTMKGHCVEPWPPPESAWTRYEARCCPARWALGQVVRPGPASCTVFLACVHSPGHQPPASAGSSTCCAVTSTHSQGQAAALAAADCDLLGPAGAEARPHSAGEHPTSARWCPGPGHDRGSGSDSAVRAGALPVSSR